MPQMSPLLWENLNWSTVIMILLVSTTLFFMMSGLPLNSNKGQTTAENNMKAFNEVSWSW